MSEPLPPWLANLDPRFVRHDWKKWVRPDWQTWMPPGTKFETKPAPRSEFERLYKPYRDEPVDPTPPRRATGLTEADILAFRSNLAALRFKIALLKLKLKALHPSNYNPEQPRVPAGYSILSGRWTRVAGPPGIGHNQGPPLEDPPEIPKVRPPTAQERNEFLKSAARWIYKATRLGGPVGAFMTALELASWLDLTVPSLIPTRTSQRLGTSCSTRRPSGSGDTTSIMW